jgi:predicted RNA-binding Zn-ribbon protein involved in translation (DUF1610 family)
MADFRCPNCGEPATGGFNYCPECGKVFCWACDKNGKNPFPGNCCPRCGNVNYKFANNWAEMREMLKNSQN